MIGPIGDVARETIVSGKLSQNQITKLVSDLQAERAEREFLQDYLVQMLTIVTESAGKRWEDRVQQVGERLLRWFEVNGDWQLHTWWVKYQKKQTKDLVKSLENYYSKEELTRIYQAIRSSTD